MNLSLFQTITLAAFGALAVAGILIFALAVGTGGQNNTVGVVTIWGTLDQSAFTAALSQIIQSDQSLAGVGYVQKDASTFNQDLANAIAEQKGPDLYVISSDDAMLNEPRVHTIPYTQISQQQFKDTFVDAASPFLGTSGIIALPFMVDPLLLYWNRDTFSSAGITQPPATWDQVPAMAESMTLKDTSGSIQQSGIAFGTYSNIENAKPVFSMLLMQSANVGESVPDPITIRNAQGALTADLDSVFNHQSPPAEDALTFYTQFANPAQSAYSWNGSFTSARSAFAQGAVGLYVGFASENAVIGATNPNLNYSTAFIPQLAHSSRLITFGRAYGFAIPLNSKNQAGAELAAEKLDTASSSLIFARSLGMASAKRKALDTQSGGAQSLIDRAALAAWNWDDPDPGATGSIFEAMIDSVGSGAKTIPDAITAAQQQLMHLLQQ